MVAPMPRRRNLWLVNPALVDPAQDVVAADVTSKRRRYSQIMGYPVCGEYLGSGRICKMGRQHVGRHLG
jgi:hypothetical protein